MNSGPEIVLVGAGGHARSVLAALRSNGYRVVGATDPRDGLHGTSIDGVAVVGGDDQLPRLLSEGVRAAALGVGGIGDNAPRAGVFGMLVELGFELPPVVSADAIVADSAELGDGTVVLAGAIVAPGARTDADVIVNTGAIVEHDCVLGAHVHVASGAVLGGDVVVEASAHIGLGAVVRNGVHIGSSALVGAGAVVVKDVADDTTVLGVPAAPRP